MREGADVQYETVSNCDLCGNSETKVVDENGHIVQCKICGLRFVSPRLVQEDISKSYDWYRAHWKGWGEVILQEKLLSERRFIFLNKFIRRGKILDVGAGLGEFLFMAKQTDRWQCFGTETSQYAVEFAKREFGIELSLGQLEDLGYQESSFDAITFWHVLEHLPYPSKALGQAQCLLKNKGFLFIAVPNDSWMGRKHFFKNTFKKAINHLPIKKKLKLKKMYPEIKEEGNKHLFYFTPHSLKKLLRKYGFIIRRHSVDYDYGKSTPGIEKKYRFDLLFCHFTGVNLSNAILIAAQKK